MRIVIGIAALIIVLISFSIYVFYQTSLISDELQSSLVKLENKIEQEEWEKAKQETKVLKKRWSKADAWWTPLMDHQEIDILSQTIVRIDRMVDMRRQEDALIEISVGRTIVESIYEMQRPDIKNIF